MGGYDDDRDDGRYDGLYVDDVYDDEVWAEHREHAEREHADRLLRHGGPPAARWEERREAA